MATTSSPDDGGGHLLPDDGNHLLPDDGAPQRPAPLLDLVNDMDLIALFWFLRCFVKNPWTTGRWS
jgi:hypothetical protein